MEGFFSPICWILGAAKRHWRSDLSTWRVVSSRLAEVACTVQRSVMTVVVRNDILMRAGRDPVPLGIPNMDKRDWPEWHGVGEG